LDYPNEAFFVSDDRLRPNTIGTVRMWLEDGEVPFVGGEFVLSSDTNTKPIDMLIDTGSGALLDISKMYAVIYSDMENKANLGASMSASGTIQPNEYVRLNHDLDFNGIVARNLMGIRGQEWSIDSAIGGDFLRRFKVSLDPVSNRMRFELADGKTQVEMPVWRIHGFRLGVNDDLQLYATEVYPDSEAEKGGLEPGDILLAFDGTPITTDPLNWPGPVLDNRITKRAYLIERDGKERTLVLGFQDMIPVPKWYKLFRDVEAEKEITKGQ
jgi:PDZ domain